MAQYNDLSRENKLLANQLYSSALRAVTNDNSGTHIGNCAGPRCDCSETRTRLMQAMVDEVAELTKQTDPEYQEFLRLQRKFPQG